MATIKYEEQAAEALKSILRDSSRSLLARRVREVLALLASNPGDPQLRRRRLHTRPALWLVDIVAGTDEVALLWYHADQPDVVVVTYVGWTSLL